MSQYENEPQDQQQAEEDRDTLANLRSAADEGKKAKRELAFVKAGIDTDTPLGAMFASAYSGDLKREDIEAAWKEIAPPPLSVEAEAQQHQVEAQAQAQQESVDVQRAQQDRMRRGIASTPAEPTQEPTIDPLKRGYDRFHQNMQDGVSRERAAKPVFEEIIGAAVAGDERFLWNGWTDEEMAEGRTSRA